MTRWILAIALLSVASIVLSALAWNDARSAIQLLRNRQSPAQASVSVADEPVEPDVAEPPVPPLDSDRPSTPEDRLSSELRAECEALRDAAAGHAKATAATLEAARKEREETGRTLLEAQALLLGLRNERLEAAEARTPSRRTPRERRPADAFVLSIQAPHVKLTLRPGEPEKPLRAITLAHAAEEVLVPKEGPIFIELKSSFAEIIAPREMKARLRLEDEGHQNRVRYR